MASTNQDFDLLAGDDVALDFTLIDFVTTDETLIGASVNWKLARSVLDADPLISKTSEDGIEITAADTFTVSLSAGDTAGLTGIYYHEATVIDGFGNTTTVTTGYVTASPTFSE